MIFHDVRSLSPFTDLIRPRSRPVTIVPFDFEELTNVRTKWVPTSAIGDGAIRQPEAARYPWRATPDTRASLGYPYVFGQLEDSENVVRRLADSVL
jgi:hypothetical protein